MEITDINIGDFFYHEFYRDMRPIEIQGIDTTDIQNPDDYEIKGIFIDGYYLHPTKLSKISPIPITDDFLEAIGFEKFDIFSEEDYKDNPDLPRDFRYGYFPHGKEAGYRIMVFKSSSEGYIFNGRIFDRYPTNTIHEFQHNLRICGLYGIFGEKIRKYLESVDKK